MSEYFVFFKLLVGQNKTSPVPLWAPGGYHGHFPLFSDVTQNKPSQQIMNIIVKCSYNLSCLWKPRGFWLTVDPRLVPAVHERLPLYRGDLVTAVISRILPRGGWHDSSADSTSCLSELSDLTLTFCKYITDPRLSNWLPSRHRWCLTGRCLRSSSCDRDFIVFARQELSVISKTDGPLQPSSRWSGPLF